MDPKVKAGIAAAFITMVGGIMYGLVTPAPDATATRVEVAFQGPVPPGTRCIWTTGQATPESLTLFGLRVDAGLYVQTRMCAAPSEEPEPNLPGSMLAIEDSQWETSYDGGPQFLAVLQGEPEFPCVCSTGSNCEELQTDGGWAPARAGMTHQPGKWRGAGCFRKACIEVSGVSSWPSECVP